MNQLKLYVALMVGEKNELFSGYFNTPEYRNVPMAFASGGKPKSKREISANDGKAENVNKYSNVERWQMAWLSAKSFSRFCTGQFSSELRHV